MAKGNYARKKEQKKPKKNAGKKRALKMITQDKLTQFGGSV